MKKIVIAFITLLMVEQSLFAQSFITIHYNNGQEPESFYEMDIDSVVYSKIGIDSIVYNKYQVQEIWGKNHVNRIPLSVIDSVSFCDPDVNVMANNFSTMTAVVEPLFMQCETTSQLEEHLPSIKAVEGIGDAWTDETTLFVKMKEGGTMAYIYPIYDNTNSIRANKVAAGGRPSFSKIIEQDVHDAFDVERICIALQPYNDESQYDGMYKLVGLTEDIEKCGMKYEVCMTPISFFLNQIFSYKIVFLDTYGYYDEKNDIHWLATDEELYVNNNTEVSSAERLRTWKKIFNKKYDKEYSDDHVYVCAIKEKRDSKECLVYYYSISEKFIATSNRESSYKTIIFNTASKSLYGKDNSYGVSHFSENLAQAFFSKGASCYIGYTDTNKTGKDAGVSLFRDLLNGASINKAAAKYAPELQSIINNKTDKICIVHPETGKYENLSTETSLHVKLNGSMKKLNAELLDGEEYGFYVSKSQGDPKKYKADVKPGEHSVSFSLELDDKDIEFGTTYYYCSYYFDGTDYCFGKEDSFNIKSQVK